MNARRRWPHAGVLCAAAVAACAPALNWREVRTEGAALSAWLPCKPEVRTRVIPLAGVPASVQVLGCTVEGSTWGVTSADVGDATLVAPVLVEWRKARSANLAGQEVAASAAAVPGMTAASDAVRLQIAGQRPDGVAVTEHALLFAVGTRVFHAAVIGGAPGRDALDTFFGNLKPAR